MGIDLERVGVVLVRPARPANVAAACRALKNMGLRRLTLVGTSAQAIPAEARALAYGAWDVLDGARSTATLAEAVAEASVVVGTTGRSAPSALTPRELAERLGGSGEEGRLALVFGPEASGLTGQELDLCHHLVHVPADPDQPSLNLAQAVLLVAYELRVASLAVSGSAASRARETEATATAGEIETALADLRGALLAIGYLNPANPDAILSELRRLLVRARVTPREIALLRGMARQTGWASSRLPGADLGRTTR
jgi:TrmH family RNA methyltransferase